MQDYNALQFFISNGKTIAFAVVAFVILVAVAGLSFGLINWLAALVLAVVAGGSGFLLLVLLDLAKIIKDVLLPQ